MSELFTLHEDRTIRMGLQMIARKRYRTIKQHDNFSCFACCACMIAGETLKDFVAFTGHDGREPDADQSHPSKVRGFTDREVFLYLADRGYTLGNWPHWDTPITVPWEDIQERTIRTETPATFESVLEVESEYFPGFYHCVFWDGQYVRDPNPKRPARSAITEYRITEWMPVVVL